MARIWGVLRRRDKIIKEHIASFEEDSPSLEAIIEALCIALDIPRPVVLSKHEHEYAQFFRTVLLPGDFIESVDFSRFEIEYLKEKKKRDSR